MKALFALLVLSLFVSLAFARVDVTDQEILAKFAKFEAKYNKVYGSAIERFHRISIFVENLERVKTMNANHDGDVFGVTKFMDLTPEEFKAKYLNVKVPSKLPEAPMKADIQELAPEAIPTVFDWGVNKSGIITPVKNQEQCGSCWAFSTTESVEAAWGLAGHSQQILSPQQIVDCDTVDDGCNGGLPSNAYKYVIKAGGQELNSAYPYTGVDGTCKFSASKVVANISSWLYVSQSAATENTKMLSYVATNGPVSVCVDAAPWQYYTGGVLKTCGTSIDHAVQATGFGVQSGVDVWNVRNSWGADWGENGYIWLKRGINLCQIATIVTAAVSN